MKRSLKKHSISLYLKYLIFHSKYGANLPQPVDLSKAQEEVEKINATEVPAQSQLPFDLLHGKSKKTTKLLANSGSTVPMNGSNRWYEFEFEEPIFLNEIIVNEEN